MYIYIYAKSSMYKNYEIKLKSVRCNLQYLSACIIFN